MLKYNAVILAGGPMKGNGVPVALRVINEKPVVDWQIDLLKEHVDKIVIACGGGCEKIKEHLKDNIENIHYSIEEKPLGTAGALRQTLKLIDKDCEFVIVCNVDDVTNIDLFALKNIKDNVICVANPRLPFGVAFLDETNYEIKEFKEKPIIQNIWASCGVYMFKVKDLKKILPIEGSLEKGIFPFMKNLKVFKHRGVWKTFKLLI